MIEAAIALGIGAMLAKTVLMPVQAALVRRQDRLDDARARAIADEAMRRARELV